MTAVRRALFAAVLFLSFAMPSLAQSPAERVADIQKALREARLDGWLFYDFRGSDALSYRILKLDVHGLATRRWFYFVPANGEPARIVHAIEQDKLDSLPGKKLVYSAWPVLHDHLRTTLRASSSRARSARAVPRIAMQYSPGNNIPYISRVDAGTIEMIRKWQVEIVTSGDLVQQFEAAWSDGQLKSHLDASDKIHRIIMEAFAEIARRIKAGIPTTEYDIQQFMVRRYAEENLTADGEDPIVAVNANAANPHYQPAREVNSPIKRGDFVLLDVWAKLKTPGSVYTDQSWTGYVGESVPEEYVRIFNIVKEARDAAMSFVKSAIADGKVIFGYQVDDVAREVVKKAGYAAKFTHRTGHSIGQEVHGNGAHMDNLETKDSRRIIARTAFSIEPGIYLEGRFGIRSEIDMYIGANEALVTGQPIQQEIIPILRDR